MFGIFSAGSSQLARGALTVGTLLLLQRSLSAQTVSACVPATGDGHSLLSKGIESAGIKRLGQKALGIDLIETESQDFQSDRTYPPYLVDGHTARLWYFPDLGMETTSGKVVNPFGTRPMFAAWSTERGSWLKRDTVYQAFPGFHRFALQNRPLNAWAVLTDWANSETVTITGRCMVRDFPRTRLTRTTPTGEEQLYLEPASGLPVQLERNEVDPTGLWGERKVVFVYSNWIKIKDSQYPMASFRLVDGEIQINRTAAPVKGDSGAPAPPNVRDTLDMRVSAAPPASEAPDTVRVSANTYLLHTRFYTNTATLVRDTVYLLDAQYDGEARARQDSIWISKLFPGKHPVVVVVSDLAWPHIAGVRTWVAMGAKVVAHRSARDFLTRVVNHRWTGKPDLLEKRRATTRFKLIAVDDSMSFAGGAVKVFPINGIGSEGSLMTWLSNDRFLFPGDYVQGLEGPSMAYAAEVVAATRRVNVAPERFAAMHMELTEWNKLLAALAPSNAAP